MFRSAVRAVVRLGVQFVRHYSVAGRPRCIRPLTAGVSVRARHATPNAAVPVSRFARAAAQAAVVRRVFCQPRGVDLSAS